MQIDLESDAFDQRIRITEQVGGTGTVIVENGDIGVSLNARACSLARQGATYLVEVGASFFELNDAVIGRP